MMKAFIRFFVSIIICNFAGAVGVVFTRTAVAGWYREIEKPFFTPPDWVFSPVWITLYVIMGVSLFLVWQKTAGKHQGKVFIPFAVQLALNALWSPVFFGLRSFIGGFIVIVVLWLAIGWTIRSFYTVSKTAAFLLVPYMLWVTFAGALNLSIVILNT